MRMTVGQRDKDVSLDAYLDTTQHEQGEQDEDGGAGCHDVGHNQPCLPV